MPLAVGVELRLYPTTFHVKRTRAVRGIQMSIVP